MMSEWTYFEKKGGVGRKSRKEKKELLYQQWLNERRDQFDKGRRVEFDGRAPAKPKQPKKNE